MGRQTTNHRIKAGMNNYMPQKAMGYVFIRDLISIYLVK